MAEKLRIPKIEGTDKEKIAQIRGYLYQLVPQLNRELENIQYEKMIVEPLEKVQTPSYLKSSKRVKKILNGNAGWYKIGVLRGEPFGMAQVAIGGKTTDVVMLDVTVEGSGARVYVRIHSTDNKIDLIGTKAEGEQAYGVYAHISDNISDTIGVCVTTHFGRFTSAGLPLLNVDDLTTNTTKQ
jgi:hypothetical protein